jgi:hypothetical protein
VCLAGCSLETVAGGRCNDKAAPKAGGFLAASCVARSSSNRSETIMPQDDHITVGMFVVTTDNFLLLPSGPSDFIDVSPAPALERDLDSRFDGQYVSVLGHMGERHRGPAEKIPSLIASRIVTHKDIQSRAFEIYLAGGSGSPLGDWLRAESELLAVTP